MEPLMRLAALPACPADAEVEFALRKAMREWAMIGGHGILDLTEHLVATQARTRRAIRDRDPPPSHAIRV
jgi:hypothetical protein